MRKFNEPSYYWSLADEYIEAQSLALKDTKYYLDKELAEMCIEFGSVLKHTAGEFAGVSFQFLDWQIESIVDIFATKYKKGKFKDLRRYQRALFFMAKKNGKSEFAGLLHAIMFFIDDEVAKEQYSIATEIEQAKIIHKVFLTMLKQEQELEDMVKCTIKPPRISKQDGAFIDEFVSLSSSADSKDGLKPSFLTIDEAHAHKTKELYQIMSDGLAGRRNPLEIHLSTAGYNLNGFFYRDIYMYAKKLKDGTMKDDRFYFKLFEPTDEDIENNDWKNPEVWKRSNPNLGVSPTYSYMEGKILQAEQSEESLIAFKTKHLNWWCDKAETWIKSNIWNSNQTPIKYNKIKSLKNKTCYGGLDLASFTDIAALVLSFPDGKGGYDVVTKFWIPKDNLKERVRRDRVPYYDWVKDGYITLTEGSIIDYEIIERDIKRLCEFFDVKIIAYDRWNSSDLIRRLTDEDITTLLPFGQGFASMSAPTKQIEVLSIQNKLNHGDNQVLNWMNSNIVLRKDAADSWKIDKDKSIEKVDGMVALAMSLGVAMVDVKEEEVVNVYEGRGLRIL